MVSFEKFLNTFRNLKPDAIPRPPRPRNVNIEEAENSESFDATEEIIIESVDSSECSDDEDKKDKNKEKKPSKKKFFSNKKKDTSSKEGSKHSKEKRHNKEPSSPINTQATGNVINIVQSKDIHWGNQITYNLGNNLQDKGRGSDEYVKKTADIKRLMEATIKPKHEYIDYIAKNLGKNWQSFFKTLGFSKGRIETVEIEEARNGVSEARYKLLLDWVRNDDDGSLGHLSSLLWEDDEREIVKDLAEIYKRNQYE